MIQAAGGFGLLPRKRFLRVEEISSHLGKSPRTLFRWVGEGRIPGPNRGLWDLEAVEAALGEMIRTRKKKKVLSFY